MFDFANIVPNSLSMSGVSMTPTDKSTAFQGAGTLILGNEGWWRIWGIMATRTQQADENLGMPDNTNINIQIFNAMTNKEWFNLDINDERTGVHNLGAPLAHVAGKWGNPKLLPSPIVCAPGQQLYIKCAHSSATTPTASVPLYVALYAQLQSSPTAQETYTPRGEPIVIPLKFPFSTTNLVRNNSATLQEQLGWDGDVLISQIMVRSADIFSASFTQSISPLLISSEVMLSLKGSTQRYGFIQPTPLPMACLASQWAARPPIYPTYFRIKKGAALIASILNQSADTLTDDLELTLSGLLVGEQ